MVNSFSCIPLNPIIETITLQTWTNSVVFCELIVSQRNYAWCMPNIDFGFLMRSECRFSWVGCHYMRWSILSFRGADNKNNLCCLLSRTNSDSALHQSTMTPAQQESFSGGSQDMQQKRGNRKPLKKKFVVLEALYFRLYARVLVFIYCYVLLVCVTFSRFG